MANDFLFTSESVTEGHPDKLCDQISDAILDACLKIDENALVACETMATGHDIIVAGEINIDGQVDYEKITRQVIKDIGYNSWELGLDYRDVNVNILLKNQSNDITRALFGDKADKSEIAAGDQGIVFGYASDETSDFMPAPIHYARTLSKELTDLRKKSQLSYLGPDGKTQVTVEYRGNQPYRIHTVLISTQHLDTTSQAQIKADMIEMINAKLPKHMLDKNTKYLINPSGRFVVGGPTCDCGLTGRKIVVDTYGGMGRHGGGAFSGKDPTKIDRSAAYASRYIAKNLVASDIASECEVQLAYSIGVSSPISININTFGTSKVSENYLAKMISELLPLTPKWIIEKFKLRRPIYLNTAKYGHFGDTNQDNGWEKTDLTAKLVSLSLAV